MRPTAIKAKLARNEPVLLTQLHLTDPSVFELASLMGFDGIWMDLEHHTYSLETASGLMRAARVGRADILARPAKGEFTRVSRLLEAGAHGIMYPRCDDAAEAARVVQWAKFPPLGRRGFDGGGPDMPYTSRPIPEYIAAANRETFVVIQLEDEGAVTHGAAIAEVDGVDVLFFGPADFSILSGFPGQLDHPRSWQAMETVAAAARQAGKHWGTSCPTLDTARRVMDMGATFICYGADIVMVKQGLEEIQETFAPLGFRF